MTSLYINQVRQGARSYFAEEGFEVREESTLTFYGTSYPELKADFTVGEEGERSIPVILLVERHSKNREKLQVWNTRARLSESSRFYGVTDEGTVILFRPCEECPGLNGEIVGFIGSVFCNHDQHRPLSVPPPRRVYNDPDELIQALDDSLEEQLNEQGLPIRVAQTITQVDSGMAILDERAKSFLFTGRGMARKLGCTSAELRDVLVNRLGVPDSERLRRLGYIRHYWSLPIPKLRPIPEAETEVQPADLDV